MLYTHTYLERLLPPWWFVLPRRCKIPGMISREEAHYYLWLGRYYEGKGEAIELGPWLGRSTFFITQGLLKSRAFLNKTLHVFDDFIWKSWMDRYYADRDDRPAEGASFLPLFERYVKPFDRVLTVERRRISTWTGNADVPGIDWTGQPIELIYVDCGRTFDENEAWWRIFSPAFIPRRTLIVMQDWQTYKETPPKSYNQTKEFTDSKGKILRLLHALRRGGVGTFVFEG